MYCQVCKKKTATVHFTELSGKEKVEVHICQDCADEKGFLLDLGNYASELIAELAGKTGFHEGAAPPQRCGACGRTFSDFKAKGRLGCGECYDAFGSVLAGIIRKIHGNAAHTGKSPDISGDAIKRRLLEKHRRELNELVRQERFEEASKLRDIIKSME